MTRISICTFILMIAFLWNSCSGKPTAIDQLKSDYKNPIDAMRLPEQPDRKKREVPRSDEPQAISKETQRGIDLSPLSKRKKIGHRASRCRHQKKVPLYKGLAQNSSKLLLHTRIRNSNCYAQFKERIPILSGTSSRTEMSKVFLFPWNPPGSLKRRSRLHEKW